MKKIVVSIAVAGLIGFVWSSSALADRPGHRQVLQTHRIHQGVHSGELTRAEARALIREQHHIRHMRHRAMADGWMSPREHAKLRHRQHVAGAHINRLKHNNRMRVPR